MAKPRVNLSPGLCKVCRCEVPAGAGVLKRHPGAPGRDTYGLAIVLCQAHKAVTFPKVWNA